MAWSQRAHPHSYSILSQVHIPTSLPVLQRRSLTPVRTPRLWRTPAAQLWKAVSCSKHSSGVHGQDWRMRDNSFLRGVGQFMACGLITVIRKCICRKTSIGYWQFWIDPSTPTVISLGSTIQPRRLQHFPTELLYLPTRDIAWILTSNNSVDMISLITVCLKYVTRVKQF